MDAFCGSSFWDPNLTLHTDSPDLTLCFQNTVLAWIPCFYLWCLLPFYIFYLKRNNSGYIVLSVLSRFKTVFAFVLWCVCWANLFYAFHGIVQSRTPPTVYFVSPLLVGITMVGTPFVDDVITLPGATLMRNMMMGSPFPSSNIAAPGSPGTAAEEFVTREGTNFAERQLRLQSRGQYPMMLP